jgi:hypothetical protein
MPLRKALIAGLTLTAAACSATAGSALPNAAAPVLDTVERAAMLLAEAAREDSDLADRTRAIQLLDRIGLRLGEDSETDPVAEWRKDAVVAGTEFIPRRGRTLGPAYRSGWLGPGEEKALTQLFLAGESARISLSSPDRSAISLKVVDPAKQIICEKNLAVSGRCEWMAVYTQRYQIIVSNPSTARIRYFLVTN